MEIFKDIEGYEGYYQVSNLGKVKSLKRLAKQSMGRGYRMVRERILKLRIDTSGYWSVGLSLDGKTKLFNVHRLIALVFIDNPMNYSDIDHIDRDKTNNNIDNLRWVNRSINVRNSKVSDNAASKYNGVYWYKKSKKWRAKCYNGVITQHIGHFFSEREAAKAFDEFCIKNNLDRELNFWEAS